MIKSSSASRIENNLLNYQYKSDFSSTYGDLKSASNYRSNQYGCKR